MTVLELLKRIMARVLTPVQGRYLPLPALEQAVRQHLSAGRISAAGTLAQKGIDRSGSNEMFRNLRARYHLARSEWDEAITCTAGLASVDAKKISATALQALRRDEEALDRLEGVTDPEAVILRVHLAVTYRRTSILSRVLNIAYDAPKDVRLEAINAAAESNVIRQLTAESRKDDFKAFLLTLKRPVRAALLLRLNAIGLARRTDPAWLGEQSQCPEDNALNQSDKILLEVAEAALMDRPLSRAFVSGPDWPQQLWDAVSPETFVDVTLRDKLRGAVDWALDDSQAHVPDIFRRLIRLHMAFAEGSPESIPVLCGKAATLFQDPRLTLDNVDGLAKRARQHAHGGTSEVLRTALVERLAHDVRTGHAAVGRHIADRFIWCAVDDDYAAPFISRINWTAPDLIHLARNLDHDHRNAFLTLILDHYPLKLPLHLFAIRDAVHADNAERLNIVLGQAKTLFASKPSAIGRILLAAELWTDADRCFESLGNAVDPEAHSEWVASLLKRGRVDAVLAAGSGGDASFLAELDRIKAARRALENCLSAGVDGPADLIPALISRAPSPYIAASGVTIVTSTLRPGGAERQVRATALGLAQRLGDHSVTVLARTLDPSIQADFFAAGIRQAGVSVSPFSALKTSDDPVLALLPMELQEFSVPLLNYFQQARPAVVHLWQDRTALGGAFAALLAGVPRIVISLRSTRPDARRRYRPYQHALFRALFAAFKGRIVIINNSHFGAADYEEWLGLTPGDISVIHNGFDLEALRVSAKSSSSVKIAPPCVGWVGRFTFEKRPELWTQTVMALARGEKPVFAIAAGDGPMRRDCAAAVREVGLDHRIQFIGVQRPIEPLMARFDLLLLTSEREGLPNVLVEAQALGVPVVTLNAGGAAEAVEAGRTGLVLPVVSTPEDIARTVQSLLDDPARRAEMSARAKIWADRKFSQTRMIEQTLAVYALGEIAGVNPSFGVAR